MLAVHNSFHTFLGYLKKLSVKIKRVFVDPFVRSQNPPWYDARGVFVGLFIGAGVPLGAQTICMGLLRLILPFNLLVAFAFTWVNNPVSVGPMYYGFYLIGSLLLNRPPVRDFHEFYLLISPILDAKHLGDASAQFLALGGDILLRWTVGSFVVAIPLGFAGYFLCLKIQTSRAVKKSSHALSSDAARSQTIEDK
ncbi:MAG: DUF2062 domain-containing protein [Deltaproteobacteria bacterium]|nr:DUF2062 domain-containing protein [Deltaproteobacteria bacterium]